MPRSRRKVFAVALGLVGLLGAATPAVARQWKITLDRISVTPVKATGQQWDADGSGPDLVGSLAAGHWMNDSCVPSTREAIPKQQNTFDFQSAVSIVMEAERPSELCFVASLSDKDLMNDDPIGQAAQQLERGQHSYDLGQATISVTAEPIGPIAGSKPSQVVSLPPPPAPAAIRYRVTLVTARIHPTKGDGLPWDEARDKDDEDERFFKSLLSIGAKAALVSSTGGAALAAALPLGGTSNGPSYKAMNAASPDPKVAVTWGAATFETRPARNTLSPHWNLTFTVTAEVATRKPLRIDVMDADDDTAEPIGTDLIPGSEVVGGNVFRRSFGGVEELVLEVEKVADAPAPLEKTIQLDTTKGWIDTGIDLVAGQLVEIRASGTHCLSGGRCMGPDGDQEVLLPVSSRTSGAQSSIRAGQLAALVSAEVYPIGSGAQAQIISNGRLLLGVATREKASSGALSATIRVFYPLQDAAD